MCVYLWNLESCSACLSLSDSGVPGVGWADCHQLVSEHLPADRIPIIPGEVDTGVGRLRKRAQYTVCVIVCAIVGERTKDKDEL